MEALLRALILGIIQGLTEFLPVSSSGHLELAKYFLGDTSVGEESLLMTVTLHAATALATLVVFRRDVWQILQGLFQGKWNEESQFAVKIIISMIPAALVGLFYEDAVDALFNQRIGLVCAMLVVTGLLLLLADRAKHNDHPVRFQDALWIGIAQAIAIMPGISRSGATVSTAVLLGIDRQKAARFSFLMVVPLILGKMSKDILDGELQSDSVSLLPLIIGFAAAFVVGIAACLWMVQLVKHSKLRYFSLYCFLVALVAYLIYTQQGALVSH